MTTKKFLLAAILALAPLVALAQPGPGPAPSPWVVNGPQISYSQGCVTIPVTVTGGCKGAGTINVGGFYVNGASVAGGVSSVFGRTGAVVGAPGDYSVGQVTGAAPIAGPTFTGTVTIPNGGVFGTPTSLTLTNATGLVPSTGLAATGTPSSTTYLRGDNTWQAVPAGGVTSVGQTFTGGLISVAGSPITTSGTLALTVAGTSGGIPYFSGASTWASSAALAANALVIGGGAGVAPATTTTGTGILTFLGTPSSANLAAALTDETGTGASVFANGPTLIAPVLGTIASGVGTNLTALNASNLASGTVGTGRLPVGKSVVAVNSVLESMLPIQTSTGASKTFATADIQLETRRSNSGSAMTDTFPASSDPGAVNGARITVNNADATASDTITPGAGTSISTCTTVPAGRSVTYVYDLANTTWRTTFNTCTAGVFAAAALGSQVAGHLVTILNANGGIQDSGIVSTAIPTSNLATTLNAKTGAYTIATTDAGKINYLNNASPFTFTIPAAGTLGANFATDLGNIGAGLLTNTLASGTFADTGNASITTVQGQELYTWVDAGAAGVHSWVSMPPIPAGGLLGNNSANKDYPFALTATQATAMLNNFTSSLAGLAPSSGGGTTNYLRADGTWAAPAGGSGCTVSGTAGQAVYNNGSTGCLSSAATFSSGGGLTLPLAGAASTPGLTVSGAPFTGGSGTTTFPQLYVNAGAAVSTFATTGTALGVNLPSASTANFEDFHVNGGASVWKVSSAGALTASGTINLSGTSGANVNLNAGSTIQSGGVDKIAFNSGNVTISTGSGSFLVSGVFAAIGSGSGLSTATCTGTVSCFTPNWGTNGNDGLGSSGTHIMDMVANAADITRWASTGMSMVTGVFTLKSFAFSGLPGSPATGSMAYITDQVAACVYGATPVGSGSNVCKVFYNGSAWIDG